VSAGANAVAVSFERVRRRECMLPTPEGVPLRVFVAEPGERLIAFLADLFLSIAIALGLVIIGLIASRVLSPVGGATFTLPILLFLSFVARNAYVLIFELRWGGVTPGKRLAGLRVGRLRRRTVAVLGSCSPQSHPAGRDLPR
jgi:uncharacterized RDD family membrane protein YckC